MSEHADDFAELSERVRIQLFGPARWIGPFPNSCRSLKEALDDQPISEFQAGLATELCRRLRGFAYVQRMADGVNRRVRVTDRELARLTETGVIAYLSRLLLAFVEDDAEGRVKLRPDYVAWVCRDYASNLTEMADGLEPTEPLGQEFREHAERLRRKADLYDRARPQFRNGRVDGGRPTTLPKPAVLRMELDALANWLRPRWKRIRASKSDRGLWAKAVQAVVMSHLVPGRSIESAALGTALWPANVRRTHATAAADILAALYGVTRRSVLRATKPTKGCR